MEILRDILTGLEEAEEKTSRKLILKDEIYHVCLLSILTRCSIE